ATPVGEPAFANSVSLPPDAVTTAEILATLRHPTDGRLNHAVENCRALELPAQDLPVPPYVLGSWLGDGHSIGARMTTDDLRELGVLGDKHIPMSYLRASKSQRRALLAGLLDTDGTVTTTGNRQYTSTSKRLADDVCELIVSPGYRCTVTARRVRGRTPAASPAAYTLSFTTVDEVFRLERKREAMRDRRRGTSTDRTSSRFIVGVRAV